MSLQITLAFLLALALIEAVPPPGYKKKPEAPDENPPKYQYEYAIHGKGTGQGKSEARDGIFASGRYYVQGKNSSQNVEYVADDWGYHPYVEYSNVGPHSKIVTQIALDAEAVKALRSKGTKIPEGINVGAAVQNQILQPVSAASSATQENSIQGDANQQSSARVSLVQHRGNSLHQESSPNHHHSYSIRHGAFQNSSPAPQVQGVQEQQQSNPIREAEVHFQGNQNNLYTDASQASAIQQQQQEAAQSHQHSYSIQHGASKSPSEATTNKQQNNLVQQAENAFYLQQQHQQVDVSQKNLEAGPAHLQQDAKVSPDQNTLYLQQELRDTNQQVVENTQQQSHAIYLNQADFKQKTLENSVAQQQLDAQPNDFYAHQNQQQQIFILGPNPNQILQPQPLVAENQGRGGFNLEQQAQILSNGGVVFLQNLNHGGHLALQQIAPSTYETPQLQPPVVVLQDQTNHQEANQKYETAALFESSGGRNSLSTTSTYDEAVNLEHMGGYGSKINVKVTPNAGAAPEHLVHDFRQLVSGQDVLNINRAINQNYEGAKLEASTAATAIVSEYAPAEGSNLIVSSTETSAVAGSTENLHTLSEEPIVVADLNVQSHSENNVIQSSTQSFLGQEEPPKNPPSSEITITPRPVSSKFLAPITAGIQLQSSEEASKTDNFIVDVQKSIPYYLGKIEYYDQPGGESPETKQINITASATQNIQLGGFLQHPVRERPNPQAMELKSQAFSQSLTSPGGDHDQVPEQGQVEQLVVDKPPVEAELQKPTLTQVIEKTVQVPVEVTRYVDRPYPVPVAVPKPYPVEVEKIVEKVVRQPYPVEVRVPVEVPVPHPVHVTVEKRIPVPQYIEKQVEKIVEKAVPQYIPKPYPVAVRVPVAVPQAFYIPVEVPKPYPVEVTKYVNKPYAVPRPYPVQVTQTIEVPIPQPVPVEVRVPHPVPVEVPKFINRVVDRPYPVFLEYQLRQQQQQQQQQQNDLRQLRPPVNNNIYQEPLVNSASFQSNVRIMPCLDLRVLGIKKSYCNTFHNNNYIGLVPPRLPFNNNYQNLTNTASQKHRKTRQNFDDNNVRLEYGFMPPLIPSLEIDEQGNPVEKHTK